jgi:hypothetical protein
MLARIGRLRHPRVGEDAGVGQGTRLLRPPCAGGICRPRRLITPQPRGGGGDAAATG